jgi:hypothetical protein
MRGEMPKFLKPGNLSNRDVKLCSDGLIPKLSDAHQRTKQTNESEDSEYPSAMDAGNAYCRNRP